jgi:hypothetical protein
MAATDTATGAITTEVRLAAGSGGIALMSGLRGGAGFSGRKVLSAHSVPLKDAATISAPNMTLRAEKVRCGPLARIGAILDTEREGATDLCFWLACARRHNFAKNRAAASHVDGAQESRSVKG